MPETRARVKEAAEIPVFLIRISVSTPSSRGLTTGSMPFRLIGHLVFGSGHERLGADRNRRQDGDGEEHRGQTQ
ncbi:hypothetical protein FIU93_06010 [Labrenzia sp. THAF35]|nr:hypothetical protein FIU93_06010 [Labrenzia sp. THAF35]